MMYNSDNYLYQLLSHPYKWEHETSLSYKSEVFLQQLWKLDKLIKRKLNLAFHMS